MRFEADRVEKIRKLAYLIRFSEKCLTKKVIDEPRVKILVVLYNNF